MKLKLLALTCLCTWKLCAQTDTLTFSQLLNMELDQMLKMKVLGPAAITSLTQAEIPASSTVITQEDIANSPARNIYDLIETFVPGAIWLNHEDGPSAGVRGVVLNRNFKYLLLVNGRNMNNKAHFGAKSELEMWDMGDIKRIEIIRGPGSVTYGPGAVGGVINIVIKEPGEVDGVQSKVRYNTNYNTTMGTVAFGKQLNKVNIYSYLSTTLADGHDSDHYLVTGDNEYGAIGKDIDMDDEVLPYFGDYKNKAQLKAHLGVKWEKWNVWSRYTQQGSNWKSNEVKTEYPQGIFSLQGTQDRQFSTMITHNSELSESLNLTASLSFDTYDTERRSDNDRDENDPDHPLNKKVDFAENEIFVRGILNYKKSENFETAFGLEYAYDMFGVGWGDDPGQMRLGDEGNIINDLNSLAIRENTNGSADRRGDPFLVGNGWSTNTYSFFSEFNVGLSEKLTLLASARIDKNDFSEFLFSPRVAVISNFAAQQYLKFIVQQSARMNTASQLFIDHENDIQPANERIRSLELAYSSYPSKNITLNIASYLNFLEVLAFEGNDNETVDVGDLELWGAEAEILYKGEKSRVGLNYSYLKQISWALSDGIDGSGISYSDYNEDISDDFGDATLTGFGNDLNNWPNQTFKLFGTYQLSNRITCYLDARYQFDYQGAKDGLSALAQATTGTSIEQDISNVLNQLESNGVYTYDLRTNFSIHFNVIDKIKLSGFVQNITNFNDNKRYAYDNGNDDPAPRKVRYVEEPSTIGIQLSYGL